MKTSTGEEKMAAVVEKLAGDRQGSRAGSDRRAVMGNRPGGIWKP